MVKHSDSVGVNHIIVYGTLRKNGGAYKSFNLDKYLEFRGEVRVPGTMFSCGGFPGVKLNTPGREFVGELYEIKDPSIIPGLDRYEGYNERDTEGSLYTREVVEVEGHPPAYIYEYVQPQAHRPTVESGDWLNRYAEAPYDLGS